MAGEIKLNSVNFASESGGTITLNNGTIGSGVVFPAGHVIQVKSVIRNTEWQGPDTTNNEHTLFATDTSTTTAHTNTAFKVEITPASNASKFLVQYAINVSNTSSGISLKLHRGIATSPIYGSSGSRTAQSSSKEFTGDDNQSSQTYYSILDEPATDSTLTYYLTYVYFAAKPWFNTNVSRNNQAYDDAYTSTLTVMEVSG